MLRLVDQPRPIIWSALRFFSARYRRRYSTRHLPDWQRTALRRAVLLPERRLLYMINAKAASSTLRKMMLEINDNVARTAPPKPEGDGLNKLLTAFTDTEVYRFTFVRHPVDRIASSFVNMFVDKKNGFYWRHLPYLWRTGLRLGDRSHENFDRFLDYVTEVKAESETFCDVHLRLQTINVSARHVQFNRVGRFENLTADLPLIIGEAGLGDVFRSDKVQWLNRSSGGHDIDISGAQRQRIYRLYEEDFDRFGYALNSPGGGHHASS